MTFDVSISLPGGRHLPEVGPTEGFADVITVKTYPSGERRISRDPLEAKLKNAFEEFGTHRSVAAAFGVSRSTVRRWLRDHEMKVVSRPEIALSKSMFLRVNLGDDRLTLSQWLMDEGSVTVNYVLRDNLTSLVVCGSMNDYEVLSHISAVLGVPITSSRLPTLRVLPLGAVRVSSARAFALLRILEPHLTGLKAMEAKAALNFFPSSGTLRGRHTTDEFLLPAWRKFALQTLHAWNLRRIRKIEEEEIQERARTWVEGRVRRSHRFLDAHVAMSAMAKQK